MKKGIIYTIIIILALLISFATLYLIDMNRMNNNLPVFFSTWGYDYAPPENGIHEVLNNSSEVLEVKNYEDGTIELEDLPENYTFNEAVENGDIVIDSWRVIYNKSFLDDFINCANNNISSRMRVVNFTIEGDMIINDYIYNDGKILNVSDNTRDEFSSKENRKITSSIYDTNEYGFMYEQSEKITTVYLAKQNITVEENESQPLNIVDKIYICSYKDFEENLLCFEETPSFVGTILEENETTLIIEPNEDEEERKITDKVSVAVQAGRDYFYGVGRKVVVFYNGRLTKQNLPRVSGATVEVDGYSDFKLKVQPISSEETVNKILNLKEIDKYQSDIDIYFYNLENVEVILNNNTYTFEEAIKSGKITKNGILSKANNDNKNGLNRKETYKDGGSTIWIYEDYSILKMNTLDGDNSIYIGNNDMDINDINRIK